MDFRQLEAFCAIVEWGNFSEASRHLFISQPTVSSHIRSLENSLNVRLINRNTKPVTITEEGKRFYEYASALLRLREKAISEFGGLSDNVIAIGASSIPSAYILPDIMAAYRRVSEDAVFDVMQSDSEGTIESLTEGSIDMAIAGASLNDDRFCCRVVYRDEMVLAVPATDYYKELIRNKTAVEIMMAEPYILRERGSGTRRESELFMENMGFSPDRIKAAARINDLESIKMSIANGLGVSILARKVTEGLERDGKIAVCPLTEEGVYRDYCLIYRKNTVKDKPVYNFIKFIEKNYCN